MGNPLPAAEFLVTRQGISEEVSRIGFPISLLRSFNNTMRPPIVFAILNSGEDSHSQQNRGIEVLAIPLHGKQRDFLALLK